MNLNWPHELQHIAAIAGKHRTSIQWQHDNSNSNIGISNSRNLKICILIALVMYNHVTKFERATNILLLLYSHNRLFV